MPDGRRSGESDHQFAARSRTIQSTLFKGGYAGISLPVEVGGQGLPGRYQAIFDQEARDYELPGVFGGTFGPVLGTLLGHLSPRDKKAHITAILSGQELWCQLMSEPGAGSDIGGIGTTAVRDGDEWIINGQKVWTTAAHLSDFAMCLTRTDWEATKYAGLTMFVVPLNSPGVTVKPLRQITGTAEFCEVFLDDVRIPAANVLGEVGGGWAVVQTWLTYEHGGVSKGSDHSRVGTQAVRSPITDAIPRALIAAAPAAGTAGLPDIRR
jgi:alkylation response protein AidB-like acyl-CoA dehydrogenase